MAYRTSIPLSDAATISCSENDIAILVFLSTRWIVTQLPSEISSREIEAKLSNRSGGRFKGGGMPGRGQGQDSFRNGLVYAKQLTELPDYSN